MGERAFLPTPKGAALTARLADRCGGRPSGQGSFGGPNPLASKQANKQERERGRERERESERGRDAYHMLGRLPYVAALKSMHAVWRLAAGIFFHRDLTPLAIISSDYVLERPTQIQACVCSKIEPLMVCLYDGSSFSCVRSGFHLPSKPLRI